MNHREFWMRITIPGSLILSFLTNFLPRFPHPSCFLILQPAAHALLSLNSTPRFPFNCLFFVLSFLLTLHYPPNLPSIKLPHSTQTTLSPTQSKKKKTHHHQMAVVRERRHLNLRLPLPTDTRPRFPLPLPPSTTTTTSSSSSSTISLQDLERLGVLGHGNSGTVYKVRHKRTSTIFALKVIQPDCDTTTRRQVFREMEILRRTDSPYVVHSHGIFENPSGDISILLEYMDAGTLDSLLLRDGAFFTEPSISNIARQILKGLHYLHSHKIVHRDIKPSNLLVNSEMEVKIADFGVSKIMCRTLDPCDSYVGTCAYMSPERFDPDTYGANYNGYAGDIWSLGLTLVELFVGHFPFSPPGQKPDWASLMCAICFGEPPSLPTSASHEFRDFIQCCLHKDSNKRWTVSQLLSHPFVIQY